MRNDLFGDGKIFDKKDSEDRYRITLSKIKEIEKLSISVLGEISGL